MNKAEQFFEWAENMRALVEDEAYEDAYITMCVHAGIAAADVISCARLGEISKSTNHEDAVTLLRATDNDLANRLKTLLGLKTKAGYHHEPASRADVDRAQRAAEALITAARQIP